MFAKLVNKNKKKEVFEEKSLQMAAFFLPRWRKDVSLPH
jgi:hypothetical protein